LILGAKVPAAAHGLKVSTRVAGGGAVAAGVLVAAGMDAGGGEGTVMVGAGAVAGAMVAFAVMVAGPVPAAGARAVVHPEARSVTARAVTLAAASVTRLATAGRLRRRARSSSSFTVSASSGSSLIVDAGDPPAVAMAQPLPPPCQRSERPWNPCRSAPSAGTADMASRQGINRSVPSQHSRMTRALGDGAGGCRRRDTPGVMRDSGLLRVFAVLRGGCGWRGPAF
jgi:hypothetical protein